MMNLLGKKTTLAQAHPLHDSTLVDFLTDTLSSMEGEEATEANQEEESSHARRGQSTPSGGDTIDVMQRVQKRN